MIKDLLSKTFGYFVNKRNDQYDTDNKEIVKCSVPVISVGNLSVGGTGKTPFVQMLGHMMKSFKHKPGVIGRGYKRNSKGEVIVYDGDSLLVDAEVGGDEMVLLAESLKIPVMAHDSKSQGAKSLEERFNIDSIIVDDGFQHRALHRDLDIVLVDKETAENPDLMPKGRLREPLESLKRADIVCLTGSFKLNGLSEHISENALVIKVKPYQGRPFNLKERAHLDKSVFYEARNGMLAVSGIAKPDRFHSMLSAQNYDLKGKIDFDDHHAYSDKDIVKIIEKARELEVKYVGTTEKDAAKISKFVDLFDDAEITCMVFPVKLKIVEGKKKFMKSIDKLFETKE